MDVLRKYLVSMFPPLSVQFSDKLGQARPDWAGGKIKLLLRSGRGKYGIRGFGDLNLGILRISCIVFLGRMRKDSRLLKFSYTKLVTTLHELQPVFCSLRKYKLVFS